MAEEEGFEPPRGVTRLSVFKTDPFSQTWVLLHVTGIIYHDAPPGVNGDERFGLIFSFAGRIINLAVLGGKVAVSCNPQSAPAGLNSFPRPFVMQGLPSARSEDVWVLRNGAP